ncbi:helix-turn-helix transcriptional regulator [Fibrisoma montanum]|uniref:Helix-turn-helix transcriptional regulator n=1 Tax=Fibrisoma montanum TaxID=2305895 RepID=A0A418MJU6_9BACT|nr:helix-turn-helix transcriptional regulator [Fibrisoma montanum]RIV27775.1 helix-turn-helix transcriptional regulator [Fibrisoma montanum]
MSTFAHLLTVQLNLVLSAQLIRVFYEYVPLNWLSIGSIIGMMSLRFWRFNESVGQERKQPATNTHYDALLQRCGQLETQLAELEVQKTTLTEALELRSRELTTQTLNLLQKNALMEEVREMISDILKVSATAAQPQKINYNRLIKLIDYSFSLDKEWEDFRVYFEQVHQSFFVRLKEICPDLTPGELRLCALVKLNLNLKESATILKISPDSVKTARYRLRKKLNVSEEQTLTDYLLTL